MFWGFSQFWLTSKAQITVKNINSSKIGHSKSDRSPVFEKILVDSSGDNNDKENKIFDIVFRLSEVKSLARYLEKKTRGKRHLQMLLAGYDKQNKCYWVKVGEDNGYMFVTSYNFYVYKNPTRIFYLDTSNDKVLSIQEWRQKNGK